MKAFAISTALALLVATVYSAPSSPKPEERVFNVEITFIGADPDANFTQLFPADNSQYPITNPLSVTTITSNGGGFCDIIAVDGSDYVIVGEDTVTVGPPQPFKFGSCQTD